MTQTSLTAATTTGTTEPAGDCTFPVSAASKRKQLVADNHDPFDPLETPDQLYSIPIHDEWEFHGIRHDEDPRDHSMHWSGNHFVPGHAGRQKCLLSIEYGQTFSPDLDTKYAYFVTIYLEPDGGLIQPKTPVGTYARIDTALVNASAILTSLPNLKKGDTLQIMKDQSHRKGGRRRTFTIS